MKSYKELWKRHLINEEIINTCSDIVYSALGNTRSSHVRESVKKFLSALRSSKTEGGGRRAQSKALELTYRWIHHITKLWDLSPKTRQVRLKEWDGEIRHRVVDGYYVFLKSMGRGFVALMPATLDADTIPPNDLVLKSLAMNKCVHPSSVLKDWVNLFPQELKMQFDEIHVLDWLPGIALYLCLNGSVIDLLVSTKDKYLLVKNLLSLPDDTDKGKLLASIYTVVASIAELGKRLKLVLDVLNDETLQTAYQAGLTLRRKHLGRVRKCARALLLLAAENIENEKLFKTPRSLLKKFVLLN